jgi:hypothetical protein
LVDGQSDTGSWGYTCHRRPASVQAGRNTPPLPTGRPRHPFNDNSNTQFAVLGLWVAQRHGVYAGQALRLTAGYFQKSQGDDGSWGYKPNTRMYRHSMTCAGLFCVAAELSKSPGYVRPSQPRATVRVTNSTITRGLRFLGKSFDAIAKGGAIESWSKLYFLWSLERVAVIYGLEKIGSQEWYPWTAELLVRSQQDNGSWRDAGPGPVSTCFALLILRRSNLTPDLLVGVPETSRPEKPVGVSGRPVQQPSSRVATPVPGLRTKPGADTPVERPASRVPTPDPGLRTKPRADTSAKPPVYRVPGPPNRPDRTDEKKD